MKRLHVHITVKNLEESIHFYSSLFDHKPTVKKQDYAKWMLDDPRVNFAISDRSEKYGLDHLGIQTENDEELSQLKNNIEAAEMPIKTEENTACCYVRSNKHWTMDPQGIAWETFHSLEEVPTFNGETESNNDKACCTPKSQTEKACC